MNGSTNSTSACSNNQPLSEPTILDLSYLPKLKKLDLDLLRNKNISGLSGSKNFTGLEELFLCNCPFLNCLDVSNFRLLKRLRLDYHSNLREVRGLENLTNLEELVLTLTNLRGSEWNLSGLTKLKKYEGIEPDPERPGWFVATDR